MMSVYRNVSVMFVILGFSAVVALPLTAQARGFQAERLAVLPFVNTTDVEQWDNLGRAMAETIDLTLRLSRQFTVVDLPEGERLDPYAPDGPLKLRRISDDLRIDAVIMGRISALPNGRVELQAAAYSSSSGEIIGEQTREAFGAFDILDAADELVLVASSAFLGYSVNFGGVILKPSRDDVPYMVYVDGYPVGQNLRSVPQILTGRRTIDVAVIGSRGEQIIYSGDQMVRPGEAIEVPFSLPAVTSSEQRQIRTNHALARELLGRPEQYLVAFETLSTSRRLLGESGSEALAPLRDEQRRLEALWQLEEEMYRLRPWVYGDDGDYQLGEPLTMMPATARIVRDGGSGAAGDTEIRQRVVRNGMAQYYLLHLAWTATLGQGQWERAEQILADMDTVQRTFDLPMAESVREDRAAWNRAVNEAEGYSRRARRPWPYLGLTAGLGGIGYGGFLFATDAVGSDVAKGDDYYDEYNLATTGVEAEALREKAEEQYDKAEFTELVQWGSIAAGGMVALISTWRIVANRRAQENYLKEWAVEQYGQEIALAERVFSPRFGDSMGDGAAGRASDEPATVLVLGPSGSVVDVAGRPQTFPFLLEVAPGEALRSDRAPVADADRTRLYQSGFGMAVLR